ncbi:hypothetical protein [Flavobacterium sp.]|uniref:hypothetical protein n=1 Tax=Flavobacterium sp. TaxID=239 RepID=UPI0032637DD5
MDYNLEKEKEMLGWFKGKVRNVALKAVGVGNNTAAQKIMAEPEILRSDYDRPVVRGSGLVRYITEELRPNNVSYEGPYTGRLNNYGERIANDKSVKSFLLFDSRSSRLADKHHRKKHLVFIYSEDTIILQIDIIRRISRWQDSESGDI